MKHYSYFLVVLYFVMLPISILSADDFILGTWDWRPSEYYPGHMQEGINRLKDAHYNTASASYDENFWGMYDTHLKYEASLDALRTQGLNVIFTDFGLNPYWRDSSPGHAADFGRVSLYNLTNSNHFRLEAEYNDDSSLNTNDANNDVFFYRFTRDTPTSDVLTHRIHQEDFLSNDWAYQYDPQSYPSDDWVTILDRMCYRWEAEDTDINNELFQFSKICAHDNPAGEYLLDNAYLNNDSLYISISMTWDEYRDITHDFMRVIFYDMATEIELPHYLFWPQGPYNLTLYTNDYADGAPDHDTFGNENFYRVFTYAISLANLRAYGFFGTDSMTYAYRVLQNFGVKVQWKQITRVTVDYLEFEDSTHRYMRLHNDQVKGWLHSYLQDRLIGTNNEHISYYTGVDEPYIGNFDSFRIVGNWLRELNLPPIASPDNDNRFGISELTKPNNEKANLMRVFNSLAQSPVMFVDHYPIAPVTQWGLPESDSNFVQIRLDQMLYRYDQCKQTCVASSTKLIAIPQTFGYWNGSPGDSYYDPDTTANSWFCFEMPTGNMLKCLKYLPLCYGVDGTSDFTLSSAGTMFMCPTDNTWLHPANAAYLPVQAANDKINVYGPIMLGAEWQGSKCIRFNDPMNTSQIADISVVNDDLSDFNAYHSYVQCALYQKAQEHYFFLVNRRTDYLNQGASASNTHYNNYTSIFHSPADSYVRFTWNGDTVFESIYGSRVGLLDPYSHNMQIINIVNHTGYTDITIPPGEATLRQIVSVFPDTLSANFTAIRDVYAKDTVVINNHSVVDLGQFKLNLLDDCCLYVMGGSTLKINSSLNAGIMSRIIVGDQCSLIINNAICQMATGSKITLEEGALILDISNAIIESPTGSTWEGIESYHSNVTLENSTLKNALCSLMLNESSLYLSRGSICVPANGIGIKIANSNDTQPIVIEGHENTNSSIYAMPGSANGTVGILMKSTHHPFYVCNTDFSALEIAIEYALSAVKFDSISTCNFYNCSKGIEFKGNDGLRLIRNCQFKIDHSPFSASYGIVAQCNAPQIRDCTFESTSNVYDFTGILLDMVQSEKERHILGCSFNNVRYGIQSRESQVRLTNNRFDNTAYGTAIGTNSLISMNDDAFNFYKSVYANIYFKDNFMATDGSEKFVADLNMRNGHNDFYHGISNCKDFRFNVLQYDLANSSKIDVTGNFWGVMPNDGQFERFPTLNSSDYDVLFICESYDDTCNVPSQEPVQNRFDQAVEYENLEAFDSAYILYEQILHERIPEEKDYWEICVPKLFNLAKGYILDYDELLSYYETEISNTDSTSKAELIWLMNTYQAFTYLEKKDYQSAADIISERINNPISEIDSLNAVMDLEIIYFQRDLDESKRPLATQYEQFHYPTLQTFNVNHMKHWEQLQRLYELENSVPGSTAPLRAVLSNCYPNPFNPSTTIEYGIPKTGMVKLKIYNIRGQLVKELVNETKEPGKYKAVWEGKNTNGHTVASGVYFYRLESGGKTITRKMLMMK